jgi:hypothetical protein
MAAIIGCKVLRLDELIEGKRFAYVAENLNGSCKSNHYQTLPDHRTFWTKQGIVCLGFFF